MKKTPPKYTKPIIKSSKIVPIYYYSRANLRSEDADSVMLAMVAC